jgi:hypothetical protein
MATSAETETPESVLNAVFATEPFYISSRGLLLPNVSVTIDGLSYIQASKIGKGVWLPAIDYLGEELYQTLINEDGGIILSLPGETACALEPLETGDRGFASGALVTWGDVVVYRVRAADDTGRGELRVSINALPEEVYLYDVDTAALLTR